MSQPNSILRPTEVRGSAGIPSVAVVITTFNHARFLDEALSSVLSQTHPVDELIVVDDGSTDHPEIVAARYPAKLIVQERQGLSAARNTGLRAATSEKIVFLDADDRLLPDAVAAGLSSFSEHSNAAFVYGGFRAISEDGAISSEDQYTAIGTDPYGDLLKGNVIGMHATVMYDRSRLIEAGGFDPSLHRCEDYDVYLRMAHTLPVASYPKVIAEYRHHGGNMSADRRDMLSWVLRVHQRQAVHASKALGTLTDWRSGRKVWREYYARELFRDAVSRWGRDKSIGPCVRMSWQAWRMAPGTMSAHISGGLLRKVSRLLPERVSYPIRRFWNRNTRIPLGGVRYGSFGRVVPVSTNFGFDRGTPIDRYYIEAFLESQKADIRGRALEIGDDSYCRRFGEGQITHQDVLHIKAGSPAATIVGDLSQAGTLPPEAFDCLVICQTLHLIYDMPAAVSEMYRALRPGGVLLLTVPGISPIDRGEWGSTWFWSLTGTAARRLLGDVFGSENVAVETHGNVFAATAFIQGLAVEEVDVSKLVIDDSSYPVIITVRAAKRSRS